MSKSPEHSHFKSSYDEGKTHLIFVKFPIMILVIFLMEFLCFLLYPLRFLSFTVIRITVITQEFIQAYKTILVTINILKEQEA